MISRSSGEKDRCHRSFSPLDLEIIELASIKLFILCLFSEVLNYHICSCFDF